MMHVHSKNSTLVDLLNISHICKIFRNLKDSKVNKYLSHFKRFRHSKDSNLMNRLNICHIYRRFRNSKVSSQFLSKIICMFGISCLLYFFSEPFDCFEIVFTSESFECFENIANSTGVSDKLIY